MIYISMKDKSLFKYVTHYFTLIVLFEEKPQSKDSTHADKSRLSTFHGLLLSLAIRGRKIH